MASVVVAGDTSGSITIAAPAVAGTNTLTLPAANATVLTSASPASDLPSSIKGPAFSAYAGSATSISNTTFTKVLFDTEEFDTNSNFASSRFTPTVAGYYQINAIVALSSSTYSNEIAIYKNGSVYKYGSYPNKATSQTAFPCISSLVYCNGSTDYVEIYAYQDSGGALNTQTGSAYVWFNGSMVRGA